MYSTPSGPHTTTSLGQGDLRLLHTPVAQRLLHAPVLARLTYTGQTSRVIPINFHWTGDELVMGAFAAAIDKPGLRMVRIGLRPTWVDVLDFQHRFPGRTPPPVLAALTQTQ